MPEEYFDLVTLHWNDETILDGRLAGGKLVKQTLTKNQVREINSLQNAHDIELQRLLRSFVNEDC